MKTIKYGLSALGLAIGMAATGFSLSVSAAEPTLSEADFEKAQLHYFQRCAGCHGVLRKGATGKNLEPKNTLKKGQKRLEKIIALGTEGGMNNFDDLFTKKEISNLATFIQMTPPVPPEMSLAQMRSHTKEYVAPKDYPTKPMHAKKNSQAIKRWMPPWCAWNLPNVLPQCWQMLTGHLVNAKL